MSKKIFQQNLELWSSHHPKEAVLLQYLECHHIKLVSFKQKHPNLKSQFDHYSELFYETEDPLQESLQWFSSLDLQNRNVLYVYGVGLGYSYEAAKSWLEEDLERHLVFLEDDLEVIAKFFETPIAANLLQNPQASLYFFKEVSETEHILNDLYWKFPMETPVFSLLDYYKKRKLQRYEELCLQLSYDAALKTNLVKEYLEYGIVFFRNFYENILTINQSFLGNSLFGKFNDVPAIICGAGPSLNKNLSLLKNLKNKALIFAGSSALNALYSAGISPDFAAGIDPNTMQEERLKKLTDLNAPFFYRGRLYPGALKCMKGPKLYITGSGGYDIADFFEKEFGIEGKFIEEGRNVVNFCLELAHAMGCNPIIFVGTDLAFSEEKAYADGVVEDPSVLEANDTVITRQDINGNQVKTMWKWVSEAKWIGDFAKMHPEKTLINATEGGLGFPNIQNIPLKDAIAKHFGKTYPLESIILSLVSAHSLSHISEKSIQESIEEIRKSLSRCMENLHLLLEENEKLLIRAKKEKMMHQTQTAKAMLAEAEFTEEPAFLYVLSIFNQVASKLMQRDIAKLFHPNNPASELDKELEKLALNKQKYEFLLRVCKVNLELLPKK